MIEVKFDPSALMFALRRLEEKCGVGVRELLYDQMHLWCNDMIKYLPPKNKGEGDRAVARDINKIFEGKNVYRMKSGLPMFKNEDGDWIPVADKYWNPSASYESMMQYHKEHRNRKTGRVRAENGGWKMKVNPQRLKSYISAIKRDVGTLKAGFVAAAQYFADKARGKAKIPVFVRQQPHKSGDYTDRSDNKGNAYLVSTNSVGWAGENKATQRWLAFTQKVRNKYISHYTNKRLQQIADRFGAEKIAEAA